MLWIPWPAAKEFAWEKVDGLMWGKQYENPLNVSLPVGTTRAGQHALKAMGISEHSWFACIHVREPGYWEGQSPSNRDGDIRSYIPLMRAVVRAGGHVVRMGDGSMTPLPHIDGVYDYAVSALKSPVVDAFLLHECRFFIGMQSGILDTALLFERPRLITNMYSPYYGFPIRQSDRGVRKNFWSAASGRSVQVLEILRNAGTKWQPNKVDLSTLGVTQTPMSEDDLEMAVIRFMVSLDQGFPEETPHPLEAELESSYRAFVESFQPGGGEDDMRDQRYRFAAQVTPGMFSRFYGI